MNKNFIYFLLLILPYIFNAQTKIEALIFYNLGTAAFDKQEYKKADSLFTLSLKKEEHLDTYYNRAFCRKKLADFNGYCVDLGSSSALGDMAAQELYWKECAKGDTIFKKKGEVVTSDSDFETAEFIYRFTYNGNMKYDMYNNLGKALVSFIRLGSDTIYEKSANVEDPQYRKGLSELGVYILQETKFGKYIKKKKINARTNLVLVISEVGKVIDAQMSTRFKDDMADTLVKELMHSPSWQPAFFNGRYVKYQLTLDMYFSENAIVSYPILPKMKILPMHISRSCDTSRVVASEANDVYTVVETMPEFPGGVQEMARYLYKNIEYPVGQRNKGVQGKCFLRFVVNSNGSICDVVVIQGVPNCGECDQEAIRVIQSMPKWSPGMQNGKPVPVFFNLPINFQLR